ncbi:MAG: hypothetical protein ACUVYA_05715, partial [Planctomycetota bacterium]
PSGRRVLALSRRSWLAGALALALASGAWAPAARSESPFVRGDATANGAVDLSDGIAILLHLFAGTDLPPCIEAANANGDGSLDLADPVCLFSHLFLGAPPPPPPYPECGFGDPERRAFSCESFEPCAAEELLELESVGEPASLQAATAGTRGAHLGPELFDALFHLAAGESVLALRGVPGFDEYFARSEALAENRADGWDERSYAPTVALDVVSAVVPLCFEMSSEILGAIGGELRSAGTIGEDWRITGAFPEKTCGAGTAPVLLRAESPSETAYVGCDVRLRAADGDPESVGVSVTPKALGVAASTDPISGTKDVRCELTTTGIVISPLGETRDQRERGWNIFGSAREPTGTFSYDDKGISARNEGYDLRNGPGPRHYLLAERTRANCLAPTTAISESRSGSFGFQVQIVCYSDGKRVDPPADCKSSVTLTGVYRSGVQARTHAGLGCFPLGSNRVEAVAKDEACLTVQDANGAQILFSKGALVQNGNKVTSQLSFDLRGNFCYKPSQGGSADATAAFGYSQTTEHTTGSRADAVEAWGFGTARVPAQAALTSTGVVSANGSRRTIARSVVDTRAVGLCFVATSDCPGARPVAGGEITAWPEYMDDLESELSAFFDAMEIEIEWTDRGRVD